MKSRKSFVRILAAGVFAALMLQAASTQAATPVAPNDPPDLGAIPPDLNQSVDPNIFVTFDDSGSMAWTHMGDFRPYDSSANSNSSWNGPWRCANVINPNIAKTDASYGVASKSMNGVYFNPNVTYTPPLYEDGTSFPNADATLKKVWQDGIAVNRPSDGNPITASTSANQYNNNPDGSSSPDTSSVTDLTGQYTVTKTPNTTTYYGGSCPGTYDTGTCQLSFPAGTNTSDSTPSGCPANAYNCQTTEICKTTNSNGSCKTHYSPRKYKYTWSDTWTWQVTTYTTSTTDNRWMCGAGGTTGGSGDGRWTASRSTQNPFDGTATDPLGGGTPNGGPVYWRFKSDALSQLTVDSSTGKFTSAAVTALYTASNWEAVSVPASQYQNFANWYAYYRYRNLMARSAMARVFGVIGGKSAANVRVAWQNLGNNSNFNSASQLPSGTIITNLDDNTTFTQNGGGSGTVGYRHAFFNWIFNVKASNGTPSRQAMKRVGDFILNNKSSNLTNPFWETDSSLSAGGQELACRQNFHMLMTDGLYNGGTVTVTGANSSTPATQNLPSPSLFLSTNDPSAYTVSASNTKTPTTVFGHSAWTNDGDGSTSYSDMSFYYWVTNLRPDLITSHPNDKVPAYFPDQTTGVTDATATVDPADPGATPEVFWNPANDPATWPHLVQFAVSLGASGALTYSDDMDCTKNTNGLGKGRNDLCYLRTGQTNSSGSTGWPQPDASYNSGNGKATNIDDLWHAALNSRGAFFVATDPSSLVQHLSDIISSVLARAQSSTSTAVSNSIQSANVKGYTGGYDSGTWSGYLYRLTLDATTAIEQAAEWDAGCILTGGTFNPIAPTSQLPPRGECKVSSPPPTPPSRIIFTSKSSGSSLVGVPFQWSSLGTTEQTYLNLDPATTDVNGSTGQVITTASSTAPATNDGNGTDRVDYLRGKRDNETSPTTETLPRQFRIRKSLLGPVINSQAMYEGGPNSGFSDIFPVGTPEQAAAAPCTGTGGLSATGCASYEKYVKDNINRRPLVYLGANDGMLHAFDAVTGSEVWAYVPHMLYGNGQLDQLTNTASTLTTTVDDTPVTSDVFFPADSTDATKGGTWHTILVGSMRLGGRGIYALDITDQSTPASETDAAGKFLWEFSSANDSDLGYTYASTNITRLQNGRWVVLLTSGYFPQKLQVESATYGKNATPDTASAASSGVTHMWVLDAQTGAVIRKIDTPSTVTSYGLSTPNAIGTSPIIAKIATAGDLAGNLWRFDLSDADPTKWSVEVMFQTYDNTSACSTSNKTGIGCEPITVQPQGFGDPAGTGIYVFGSGQYLGPSDRTASSVIGTNHFFGVRDYGTGSSKYPLHESDLVTQTLTQNTAGIRYLTSNTVPTTKAGWKIPLNVSGISGERNVVKATPLFSAGIAVLYSLIPGANNDPCTPGRIGAVMAVNAATGGPVNPPSTSGGTVAVGAEVMNPPATGGGAVISPAGGGSVIIPGVGIIGGSGNSSFTIDGGLPIWRRTSWRDVLNNQ